MIKNKTQTAAINIVNKRISINLAFRMRLCFILNEATMA